MAGWFDRMLTRRLGRRMTTLAARADHLPPARVAAAAAAARALRAAGARLVDRAEQRLALPVMGEGAVRRPLGCDWAWRPAAWRLPLSPPGLAGAASGAELDDGASVFHDCPHGAFAVRQARNRAAGDVAPFRLEAEVLRFAGSFLSVVVDLPSAAAAGLTRQHIMRAAAVIEMERKLDIFARLNIVHGPNTARLVQALPAPDHNGDAVVEFDLAYSEINERRVEWIWLDLIFDAPALNRVALRDLTLLRRPRNEI